MAPNVTLLAKVNDLLKDEDDLAKIESLSDDLKKERLSIGSQLNIECDKRIAHMTAMFENLQTSSKYLKNLKENLNKVEELKNNSVSSINKYELFDTSSVLYSNFAKVESTYNNFVRLGQRIEYVDRLLDEELPPDDYFPEESKANNLLVIHYELNQLRDFKEELMELTGTLREEMRQIVIKFFQKLDRVVEKFDKLLKLIVDSFVNIIGVSNFGVIVKVVKIIEYEEREDLRLKVIHYLINENKANFKNIEDGASGKLKNYVSRTKVRGYKKMFQDFIKESIQARFESIVQSCSQDEVLAIIQENYYEILEAYKIGAERGFPKSWDYFNKILSWYLLNFIQLNLNIHLQSIFEEQ